MIVLLWKQAHEIAPPLSTFREIYSDKPCVRWTSCPKRGDKPCWKQISKHRFLRGQMDDQMVMKRVMSHVSSFRVLPRRRARIQMPKHFPRANLVAFLRDSLCLGWTTNRTCGEHAAATSWFRGLGGEGMSSFEPASSSTRDY